MVLAAQHMRQAKKRRRLASYLRFEICSVGWLPIVQHSPHEASSASTDVHEGVVLLFQVTMAGYLSEPDGLPSQLSASVISQDSQLISMEWLCFALALALGMVALC